MRQAIQPIKKKNIPQEVMVLRPTFEDGTIQINLSYEKEYTSDAAGEVQLPQETPKKVTRQKEQLSTHERIERVRRPIRQAHGHRDLDQTRPIPVVQKKTPAKQPGERSKTLANRPHLLSARQYKRVQRHKNRTLIPTAGERTWHK